MDGEAGHARIQVLAHVHSCKLPLYFLGLPVLHHKRISGRPLAGVERFALVRILLFHGYRYQILQARGR